MRDIVGRIVAGLKGSPAIESVPVTELDALFDETFGAALAPHLERGVVRWHSTPGSARFDLRYDPIDYTTDPRVWGISTNHGMATAREQALTVSAATTREALRWFAEAVAPNGLLALFEAQRALPAVRFGIENYLQQILALAFVLAREGSLQAARQTLERALDLGIATDAAADELRRHYRQCSAGGRFRRARDLTRRSGE